MITGDVKYHEAQSAKDLGICVLDAGHYGTEKFFAANMKKMLDKELDGKTEVIASKMNIDPFMTVLYEGRKQLHDITDTQQKQKNLKKGF